MAEEKELTAEVETPAAEEAPAEVEDAPAGEEAPVQAEELPAGEEAPVEVEDAPAGEEVPAEAEESPAGEEAPVQAEAEESPAWEEAPAEAEESPAGEEAPAEAEESPAGEEAPAEAEDAPAGEEVPVQAEESPAGEEVPVQAEEVQSEEKKTGSKREEQEEKTSAPAKAEETATPVREKKTAKDAVLTAIGVLLCVILAPILIANVTMIVKSFVNSDEVPSVGGYCPFIVMTDSMKGTIDGGDLVFDKVVTDPAEIKKGDIISFFDPASRSKSIVTHRVVEVVADKDGLSFRTKGDANNTEDDDLIPAKDVVGTYQFKISGAGNVIMFMQSTPGLVVCIALPILLLIGYDALRRRKYEKQQQADTDALLKELEELRAKQGK